MKNGKRLTLAQKVLLEKNNLDPKEYLRVKDLPEYVQFVHKITGKPVMIMKD